jgi:hypothetical protein
MLKGLKLKGLKRIKRMKLKGDDPIPYQNAIGKR